MKLSSLAKEIEGKVTGDAEIASLCTDSRVAGEGDLFFCYQGTQLDGHDYAEEAVAKGVEAIVCERPLDLEVPQLIVKDGREAMARLAAAFYRHPERELCIVGVTGTNGKTTVAHMLLSILTAAGVNAGMVGTLGAKYGEISIPPSLTTPDPVYLFSLLADMLKSGVTHVVMEVSAHALALKKECPIVYGVAIFTNLSQDHLDFFGTVEEYGKAKRALFTPERCRLAVVNADDPFGEGLLNCGAPVVTYGLDNPADCFAVPEREDLKGSRFVLNLEDDLCTAELALTGRHNVYNALAAGAACRRLGISVEAIASGLKATSVDGRLERVGTQNGAELFVDFAHTPDGLEKSLASLKGHCTGKLVLVFGCGGNRDRGKRPKMGEVAAKYADFSVITSDNPRFEDACAIISEIEAGYRPVSKNYICIEERGKAIAYALSILNEGDVLLVAGKGGERTQEIMGIKYSFDDKAVIKALLEK